MIKELSGHRMVRDLRIIINIYSPSVVGGSGGESYKQSYIWVLVSW